MRHNNRSISTTIILSVFTFTTITIGTLGCVVFLNWLWSANRTVTKLADEINSDIYHQIRMFLQEPEHINEVNRRLLENGIVDLDSGIERERFFSGVLQTHDSHVHSFGYGTESGRYYGAHRTGENSIESIGNGLETDNRSAYDSVTADSNAGERTADAGYFDPRTQDWYQAAKQTGEPVFSLISRHFNPDDRTISAALPIYDSTGQLQGVLSSQITLSRIDEYLNRTVRDANAFAVIVETETGNVVASSLGLEHRSILEPDPEPRTAGKESALNVIRNAYEAFRSSRIDTIRITEHNEIHNARMKEYRKAGIGWLVVTAVPDSLFTKEIYDSMKLTLVLTGLALVLLIAVFLRIIDEYLRPIDHLIYVAERLSHGDLSQRARFSRNDKIGVLAVAINKMAETVVSLIKDLEFKVKERTEEIEQANTELKEHKDRLQLLLDSTAEAIYGIDLNGRCTFCNPSTVRLLGYRNPDELIGLNMHETIHHSYRDGTPMAEDDCRVLRALRVGEGTHVDDEVFWRADGSFFEVEYYSYPQCKDGKVVGAVITFMDNTEQKHNVERIKYLSVHDSLTGLYNRYYFEEELRQLDSPRNLPISIVFGDVDGLKLTNDIFGHSEGDKLIRKAADILKRTCRESDIIARIGGDEFAILLPRTGTDDAEKIIHRITDELSKERIIAVRCGMSLGSGTKTDSETDIESILKIAEDCMYRNKTLTRKAVGSRMLETIMETLQVKNPREKEHTREVSELCVKIGTALQLPRTEIRKLRDAGYYHDIGKIVLDDGILNKVGELSGEERKNVQQHALIGYRILNLFEDTLGFAEAVIHHHENWDGSGYPNGLKGKEIPKLARIIRIAESYTSMIQGMNKNPRRKEEALREIRNSSGVVFDPEITNVFLECAAKER